MKNSALVALREAVARWMVRNSDNLLQKSNFVKGLLQTLPGLKYIFAQAWVGIHRTRLPHRWVDALKGQSIHSIAVATDSNEPSEFDGFDAWEQSEKRREFDPGFEDKQPVPEPTLRRASILRLNMSNRSRIGLPAGSMRPRPAEFREFPVSGRVRYRSMRRQSQNAAAG